MQLPSPSRRPLKIFAPDPMRRTAGNRVTIDVGNEPLKPGPQGAHDMIRICKVEREYGRPDA